MADTAQNDELLDKTEELLEKHEELKEVLSDEASITNDVLAANELINDELEKSVSFHKEITESTKEEEETDENILDKRSAINERLVDTSDIKEEINSKTKDSLNIEDDVLAKLFEQNRVIDIILQKKEKLTSKVRDCNVEEEKLLGFSNDIITALQTALSVQLQLNAAIAAGNNGGGNGGNGGGGNGNGSGNGSGNNNGNDNGGNNAAKNSKLGNVASSAFQSGIAYLQKIATEVLHKWVEIDKQTFTTGRKMGMTLSQMSNFRKNITANYGDIANRLGMTFEEIFKFQQSYIQQTGRAIALTNKQVESFAGLSKIVGESAVNDMAKNMDEFGASSQAAIDNLTLNLARAASQGLNVEETSSKFAKNIKLASRYTFKNGVDGISKMTLMSQRLKFNMESISQAMDKFSTIEDAISSSANLQVLGGAYAANFSNPLIAMGEALIDGEGFTKRIIDTISRTAMFNANTGMVEMSPIEKAKMREAAKITGINYDELWNMASQQAKLSNIEKYIGGKNFTDEQKAFLANTAQYDAKTREWYITKMGKKGEEQVKLSDISNSSELSDIQRSNDFEKSIQGDVHNIRENLDEYLKKYVQDSKTAEETMKGQKERVLIDFSDTANATLGEIKELLKGMSKTEFIMSSALYGLSGFLLGKGTSFVGDLLKGIGGGGGGGASTVGGLGKLLGKLVLKAAPVAAVGASVISSGINAKDAINEHDKRVEEIKSDNTLSETEKEEAISESENERNKAVGKNVGQGTGSIIGAKAGHVIGKVARKTVGKIAGRVIGRKIGGAIGAIGGPLGALVGVGIGHVIGGVVGNWIGDKISTSENDETKNNGSDNLVSSSAKANAANANGSSNNTEVRQTYESLPNSNDLAMADDIHSIKKTVESISASANETYPNFARTKNSFASNVAQDVDRHGITNNVANAQVKHNISNAHGITNNVVNAKDNTAVRNLSNSSMLAMSSKTLNVDNKLVNGRITKTNNLTESNESLNVDNARVKQNINNNSNVTNKIANTKVKPVVENVTNNSSLAMLSEMPNVDNTNLRTNVRNTHDVTNNVANTKVRQTFESFPNFNDLAMASDIHSIKKSVEMMSFPENEIYSNFMIKKNSFANNIMSVNYVNNNSIENSNSYEHGSMVIPYKQYDKKTYIREIAVVPNNGTVNSQKTIDKIDINISGTLKLQGEGKSKNIDIEEVFKSPEFQRMLMAKINEGFSKNGSVVQTRSLDSTQAIMGGYYTPNYLNSKV